MYPYVFLVLDFLVERHSYERTIDFFRRRRGSADAGANFRAAFGESLPEFQAAVDARKAKVLE